MLNYIYLRRLLIFIAILFSLSACRTAPIYGPNVSVSGHIGGPGHPPAHAPAHGRRGFHNYYYYPDVEVYFDIGRQSYFYFTDNVWRISATLPHALSLRLGSHISLELDTVKPYHYHKKHRKHYPRGYFKKKHKRNKGKHDRGRGKGRGKGRDHD